MKYINIYIIVSVNVDEQSVSILVLLTMINIYVGYIETICREAGCQFLRVVWAATAFFAQERP